jgi:hypothetical protein
MHVLRIICKLHLRAASVTWVVVAFRTPNGISAEQICQSVGAAASSIITVAWDRVLAGWGGGGWLTK